MLSRISLVLLMVGSVACSRDDGEATGPVETSIAGVYNLVSVDGTPMPYLIFEDVNEKSECTGGSLTLTNGTGVSRGTFVTRVQLRFEEKATGTVHNNERIIDGAWERDGLSLTLDDDGDNQPEATATISGDRLTLNGVDGGATEVWEK